MGGSCGKSLFGPSDGIIKYQGGDMVSIEGSNILERLLLSSVTIHYKQILKGRIVLQPGEDSYLMNHLGLGNNATLVAMVVKYDPKSKLEVDNYIEYEYVNNVGVKYPIAQVLTLNGNSTHRIPQLYLSNPNEKYSVSIDVMVAVVDDQTSEFSTISPIITFTNNVFDFTGGLQQIGFPTTETSSSFFTTIDRSIVGIFNPITLIDTVGDDIDSILKSDIKFEVISTTSTSGVLQSMLYRVSVVDTSYNLTEVELIVSIIN